MLGNFHQVFLNKMHCPLDYEPQRLTKHLAIGQFLTLFNTTTMI